MFFGGEKLLAGGRSKYPARNQTCLTYGKIEDFKKVFFSANQLSDSAAIQLEPCESSNTEDASVLKHIIIIISYRKFRLETCNSALFS